MVAEQADYRTLAIAYVQKAAPTEQTNGRKVHRLTSYNLLCCLDNVLRVMTGSGLSAYQREERMKSDDGASTPMQLTLCMDQGSDGWCLVFYMLFALKLRAVVLFNIVTVFGRT